MNYNKKDIIDVIRKSTEENKGIPLGKLRFKKETGITPYMWSKYWAKFSDAQKEAGIVPNKLQPAYDDGFIIGKVIELMLKRKKFPTYAEIFVESNEDAEFPSKATVQRLGNKKQLANKIIEHCKNKKGCNNIVDLCQAVINCSHKRVDDDGSAGSHVIGEVYLFKSGRFYKIGKTNDTVRRGKELRIQLPERCVLIHSIKTDDPSGIEAYWHNRFKEKRKNGEWFDLNSADVKSFKRWRRIH